MSRLPDDSQRRSILRERARRLAVPAAASEGPSAAILELLRFRLGDEEYAFETRHVVAVHALSQLSVMPCTPDHIAGIMNARGRVLPVMHLGRFFELPQRGLGDHHRVIHLRAGEIQAGVLADLGVEVVSRPASQLQRSLPTLTGRRADYLLGVASDGLIVLDAERILQDPRIVVNEEVAG